MSREQYIKDLEDRVRDSAALASRAIQLEHDLMLARAAVADLKHKLFLIGSEEVIQDAIAGHSVGLFVKYPLPKVKIRKSPKRKPHR